MEWNLSDLKNQLDEVVDKALSEGPQKIYRQKGSIVLMSEEEYIELTTNKKTFKQHLMEGIDFEGLDLSRDSSPMRNVDL